MVDKFHLDTTVYLDVFNADIKKAIAYYLRQASFRKLPDGTCVTMLAMFEKAMLEQILNYVRGNQVRASESLGINRNTLRKRCAQYGINPIDYTQYGSIGALQGRNSV